MSSVKEDFRNLVYNLCEDRELPLLVTDIIAGYLVHRDLFNINTLSRRLNAQANAHIYRNVVVDLDGSAEPLQKASLLFRTLLVSQTAAHAVRTLSLSGDPLQGWRNNFSRIQDGESIEHPLRDKTPPALRADLAHFTQEEIELYDNLAALPSVNKRPPTSEVPVWALYLHALRLAPHIEGFSVSSDYFRFPDFRATLQVIARDSFMENLRSCSLCLDLLNGKRRHACVVKDWDSALLMPFTAPDIQSIAAVVSLKAEAVRQLRPGGSPITRLTLHHYQSQTFDLSSLLAATPNLTYLKYHATTDYGWLTAKRREQDVGLEPLYDALYHVSDSLQELHMSHEFDEDSIHFSPDYARGYEPLFRQRRELSSLKRLHTLTIPYATLLGWEHKVCVWDWVMILPSSLRHIVLTDDLHSSCPFNCWTDENLKPVISGLAEWLSATQRGSEAAELGMHLAIVNGAGDFNEPARQEITRICEEHGVRCTIVKVHADRYRSSTAPTSQVARGRGRGRGQSTRGRGRGRGT